MKLRPLSDCIIVKQHEEEVTTASGIILTAGKADKKFQGEVIAVGTGKIMDNGGVRMMGIAVGETVLFGEYSGQKFKYEGEEFLMMREPDVIGIIDK